MAANAAAGAVPPLSMAAASTPAAAHAQEHGRFVFADGATYGEILHWGNDVPRLGLMM
jgi:hypothetical protein